MSLTKIASTTAAIAAVAAMNIVTLGSAAQAHDGRFEGRNWREQAHAYHPAPPARFAYRGGHEERHDRNKGLARGLAIGLGAAIVGTIIAAEANKNRRYEDVE